MRECIQDNTWVFRRLLAPSVTLLPFPLTSSVRLFGMQQNTRVQRRLVACKKSH